MTDSSNYRNFFMATKLTKKPTSEIEKFSSTLHADISKLIEKAKRHVAKEFNSMQVLLNWMIGKRIDEEFLNKKRAKYGEKIIDTIAKGLSLEYGRGYGRINLFRMLKFSRLFPDRKIVSTLSKQLSWSHFLLLFSIDNDLKRSFYTEMCRVQHWSVRTFKAQIDSQLYERTAISKQPEEVIKKHLLALKGKDFISPELTFKDPYFISFVAGKNYNDETDLENL